MTIKRLWEGLKTLSSQISRANQGATLPPLSLSQEEQRSLYQYQSARWLWNEKEQLASRYRRFNVDELLKAGAKATGSQYCVGLMRFPDGNFNRALLLRMNDSKEVVAKVPSPNAGRPHLLTASEVATMDYVRNVLDVPIPRVLDWCSDAQNTPVGAEYVIMEKVPGRPLEDFWNGMKGEDQNALIEQLVQFQSKFASARFPIHGSIFYANDVAHTAESEIQQDKVPRRFVVGPTTCRASFDKRRSEVDVDCGPWRTAEEYFLAIIEREKACVSAFGGCSRGMGVYNAPGLYYPSSEAKLSSLSKAESILRPLLAIETLKLEPTIWHSDLHSNNILVDPKVPSRITGIIDWQSVSVQPRFRQVGYPFFLGSAGSLPEGLHPIRTPENFDSMSEEQQQTVRNDQAAKSLLKLYEIALLQQAPDMYRTLCAPNRPRQTMYFLKMLDLISGDAEPCLDDLLLEIAEEWDKYGKGTPCPLSFSEENKKKIKETMEKLEKSVELMAEVIHNVGVYQGWDGLIHPEQHAEMLKVLAKWKTRFVERHASSEEEKEVWAAAWPFQAQK